MSQYRVWKHPDTKVTETVKQGWSWPAFLFAVPWAFVKRMNLLAIFTLLGVMVIVYAIISIDAIRIEDEDGALSGVLSLLLGLIFGANGNSWRERHLRKRGFVLRRTIKRTPLKTFFAHPIVGLSALWNDPVWSKVISGIILAIGGVITAYFFLPSSTLSSHDSTKSHHSYVQSCKSATLYGHIIPNGEETFVWFEWGETPDLGNVTKQQRFTDETNYYQHLVDLKESTTYFYITIALNSNGRGEGRVNSFTTARCER
jgi:hypothetical protein